MRVPFPPTFDLENAIRFAAQLQALPHSEECQFDFSTMTCAEPLGLLYGAQAIRRFLDARRGDTKFTAVRFHENDCHGYCAHVGFFRTLGLDWGKRPGAPPGSSRYIPITELEIAEIHGRALDEGYSAKEYLKRKSQALAQVLTQTKSGDLVEALSYSFREMLWNALEHSEAPKVSYVAQYWPAKGRVTFAVLDEGIGLRASLAPNSGLRIRDDRDAIRYAILPGVSGKAFAGSRINRWDDKGLGLFMTCTLARAAGRFLMVSGTEGLRWDPARKRYFGSDLPGTALEVTLEMEAIRDIDATLEAIRLRGEHLEQMMRAAGHFSEECASRLLSGDA